MSICVARAFLAAACLVWLTGCESATKTSEFFRGAGSPETTASIPESASVKPDAAFAASDTTGTLQPSPGAPEVTDTSKSPVVVAQPPAVVAPPPAVVAPPVLAAQPPPYPLGPWSAAEDPFDDLALGKRHFREENYGLAELHFRRVAEKDNVPAQRKAEAFIGLGASYDRLKRFELADRAYHAAIAILGPTPEILNNQGFSYMLRGDYTRAQKKLREALALDPTNPYIQNNLELLEKSMRGGGGRKKV
jgi:tetratricopeptide (TPR) repeat protein